MIVSDVGKIAYDPPRLPLGRGGNRSVSPPYRGGVRGGAIVAHVAKGLEPKANLTMHEVIQSELPASLRRRVVTISGPSTAKEFVRGISTAVVAASQDARATQFVQKVFTSDIFRVAISTDWKGVSICGTLKNVYAIALGMCAGLELKMTAKTFMLVAALQEMARIVPALDGRVKTVYGLAGIGDLALTGFGDSRNRALGERICREGSCKFLLKDKGAQTHEGVAAAKVFYKLARRKIKAPLITTVYRVLYGGVDPCKAIQHFFTTCRFT